MSLQAACAAGCSVVVLMTLMWSLFAGRCDRQVRTRAEAPHRRDRAQDARDGQPQQEAGALARSAARCVQGTAASHAHHCEQHNTPLSCMVFRGFGFSWVYRKGAHPCPSFTSGCITAKTACDTSIIFTVIVAQFTLCTTALLLFSEAINTGPLEATIHNMGKEIEHKTKEGQELQRRWINKQTELVALQVRLGTACWLTCVAYLTRPSCHKLAALSTSSTLQHHGAP